MLTYSINNKDGFLSYIYLFSYAIALISLFAQATLMDGNIMYVTNPTNDVFLDVICHYLILVAIIINLILFILNSSNVYKISKINFIVLCLITVFLVINFLNNLPVITMTCFLFYLFILNSLVINPDTFIKTDFYLKFVIIVTVITVYFLHLFPSNNIPDDFVRNGSIRYCLGFNYPTTLASVILGLILSFVLAYGYRIKPVCLISLVGLIGFYFYHLTVTRGLELSTICLVLLLVFIIFKKFRRIIIEYSAYIIVFSLLLSILSILYYKYSLPLSSKINQLMSDRLTYELQAVSNFHIKLFYGSSLPKISIYTPRNIINMTIIDNGFISFLIRFGVIGTIFYEYFFIKSSLIAKRCNNILLSCALLVMVVQFFFESDYDKIWMIAPLIYAFSMEHQIYLHKCKFINTK